jgi:hypothetical protein
LRTLYKESRFNSFRYFSLNPEAYGLFERVSNLRSRFRKCGFFTLWIDFGGCIENFITSPTSIHIRYFSLNPEPEAYGLFERVMELTI